MGRASAEFCELHHQPLGGQLAEEDGARDQNGEGNPCTGHIHTDRIIAHNVSNGQDDSCILAYIRQGSGRPDHGRLSQPHRRSHGACRQAHAAQL